MALRPADDVFVKNLSARLPEKVLQPAEPRYLEEPRGRWLGKSAVVARPKTTQHVSTILEAANASGVAVIPYGGGTGLVGGQIMENGPTPIIVSLERMNKIREIHAMENILIAEAGTILADIQSIAEDVGRIFPLSLAAENSARIGGNLSTNAGGINVLRYGNARDLCIGLEAVLPDGAIWNGLSRLKKDNTGYDLRNLLIGSEGTLGIITAATLKLFMKPTTYVTAFLEVTSPSAAIEILSILRNEVGETISAFELIHRQGFDFLREKLPTIRLPFQNESEWLVLLELGLVVASDDQNAMETLFKLGNEQGLLRNILVAQSDAQRQEFWCVRENIPEANRLVGHISSHDISLPLAGIPEFIHRADRLISAIGDFRVNCFGHLGDGNLHYNVFPAHGKSPHYFLNDHENIKHQVHELVDSMKGSVSAEHGVGRLKVTDIERYSDPAKIKAMRAIKNALDPKGIMNPGAVLRAPTF